MSNPLIDDATEKLTASIWSRLNAKDAEIARLRAALAPFADDNNWSEDNVYSAWHWYGHLSDMRLGKPAEFARKALEGTSCSGE